MGDLADDMIDGAACSICGMYFRDPEDKGKCFTHGYPVACKSCYHASMQKDGIQKALVRSF